MAVGKCIVPGRSDVMIQGCRGFGFLQQNQLCFNLGSFFMGWRSGKRNIPEAEPCCGGEVFRGCMGPFRQTIPRIATKMKPAARLNLRPDGSDLTGDILTSLALATLVRVSCWKVSRRAVKSTP